MANKKKRKAPRVLKWITQCPEAVTKEGRLRKGWRPPAAPGECPRPGKGVGIKRTKGIVRHTKSCSPLMRKAVGVGWKRGYSACEKMLPEDLQHRVAKHKAAAAANVESNEAAWAMSHGIPTVLSGARGRRKKSKSSRRR